MNARIKKRYVAKAGIVKAMAHPTRLFIVDELSRRERCVQDLTRMVGDDVSTISKHLAVLKNVGIVSDEKRGSQVYYRLHCPCVLDFFSCVESVIKKRAEK